MAMTQQERDEKRKQKAAKRNEKEIRFKALPATVQALSEVMGWAEVEEIGEAMTLMIHRIHELGEGAAKHFLSAPHHKIELSEIVARKLDQFRIGRELRAPDIFNGEDPDDSGIIVVDRLPHGERECLAAQISILEQA